MTGGADDGERRAAARFHLALGWWQLAFWLTLGLALEALHAWKADFILSEDADVRRLMLRLAHSHGTLFGLVHIAYAATLDRFRIPVSRIASRALAGGSLLLPGGFLGGAFFARSGDPGLLVVLAPVGGVLVAIAVVVIARGVHRRAA